MGAVWMRVRAEARLRWRAWAALSVLLGVFGGAVMGAAAGARRTDSAYPRFLEGTRAADVQVFVLPFGEVFADLDLDEVERLPEVEEAVRIRQIVIGNDAGSILASPDDRYGYEMNTFRPIEGRLPHRDSPDEVSIPFGMQGLDPAEHKGLAPAIRAEVGDELRVSLFDFADPAARGPEVTLTVVGIHAGAGEFPPVLDEESYALFASSAFLRAHPDPPSVLEASAIRLRDTPGAATTLREHLRELGEGRVTFTNELIQQNHNVRRGISVQAVSLWLVALIAGVTVLLVLGQLVARQSFMEASEDPTLLALGMTGWNILGAAALRGLIVAVTGCVLAIGVALAVSPFFPRGTARIAELSRGVSFDAIVIGVGCAVTLLVVVGLTMAAAWRSGRAVAHGERTRPSVAARAMAGAGFSPSAVSGVRMALEPGRGHTAVPVRTTIFSIAVGVSALVAAITFGRSLDNLLDTPRLYGRSWDVSLSPADAGEFFPDARPLAPIAARQPGVEAVAVGTKGIPIQVDGLVTSGVAFDPVKGSIVPPILDGRGPTRDDEIVVGTSILAELGKRIGDEVSVSVQGISPVRMTIVGRGVIPPSESTSGFGTGVFFQHLALERIGEANPAIREVIPPPDEVAVRYDPNLDAGERARSDAAIRAELRGRLQDDFTNPDPTDLANFGRMRNLPVVLAGVMTLLALSTLAHALLTAIRRRRRDLAILKTVGFVRGQVRRTVAWQAAALALISVAVGMPAGIAAGRSLWTLFAERSGVVPQPVTPLGVLLFVPILVVLALAISALPARTAARTQPALTLRSE